MAATMEKRQCPKCGKMLTDKTGFYHLKDGSAFELCKKCTTMHLDCFDPESFMWILEKADVPYSEVQWNMLRDEQYAKDPKKMSVVLGKYFSKMRLKQWRDKTWADTEAVRAEEEANKKQYLEEHPEAALQDAQIEDAYQAGMINEAEYRTRLGTAAQYKKDSEQETVYTQMIGNGSLTPNDAFMNTQIDNNILDQFVDPAGDLTPEDKLYLAMKWGTLYKPSEWIELEKFYSEMFNSFDIQDADSINTLKLICKTNLKANQALDMNDIEGFQKLSRVLDSMRKSAKFTAAQNKDEKGDFVDCVGNLVAYCEEQGGRIPRYQIEENYDIIDKVIKDLKEYTKSLVYADTSLARQIENYLDQRKAADAKKKMEEEAKAQGKEAPDISDEDIIDHVNDVREQQEIDNELTSTFDDKEV